MKDTMDKSRALFHRQIIFGNAFALLTSGVFLSGLAMYMGAGDILVSYISIITNIGGIFILFFSPVMERFVSFKRMTIFLTVLSRGATVLMGFIPLFFRGKAQLLVFVPLMFLAFALQAQTTVMLNNWMVHFMDEKKSGKYIARRQTVVLTVTVIFLLTGGRVLDALSGRYIGFMMLFSVAFLMALIEILVLLRIPDVSRERSVGRKNRMADMVLVPIRCRLFLGFVVYIFLFYLLLSLADSFTVVYMMRYLELSYVETTAMQMLISLPQLFMLGFWGKIGDRKGHQFALMLSVWFFAGETFFMALSNPGNMYFLIPVAFLFASIGNAGFLVSVFNRRYELMPEQGRILYDNFYTAAIGLAFILGPITGGGIKTFLESADWVSGVIQFGNIRMLYLISAAAIVLLQVVIVFRKKNRMRKNFCETAECQI